MAVAIHSAHFFELSDQPVEVLVAVTSEQSVRLFERLRAEKVHLFYVKTQWNSASWASTRKGDLSEAGRGLTLCSSEID